MKRKSFGVVVIVLFALCSSWRPVKNDWLKETRNGYTFLYTNADQSNRKEYCEIIDNGIKSVRYFFNDDFKKAFEVYIHPNRNSLDKQWQSDWSVPDFKSECWMVASGIATKIDMISPIRWKEEACEHSYDNKVKTQQLVTHELFHVYHAQFNSTPDFSDAVGMDWFVEGFATYASGQLDNGRLMEIKSAIKENTVPANLDNFWKGKMRYGLSGSLVMYIDKHYGTKKLKELLVFNKKEQVLIALNTTENDLLKSWADFITKQTGQ